MDSGGLSDSGDVQTVRLRDGRVLAYAEAGASQGVPVVSWFDDESVPRADRELVARPEDRNRIAESVREALRAGIDGYVQDELILTARPWGFRAEQIAVSAYLWHGELDTFAPVGGARYLARVIPGCRARFFADEAHMISLRHGEDVLRALVEASSA